MKRLLISLLLLPCIAAAQNPTQGIDDALKQMEKMKAGMTPAQRKQFESNGVEQKLRETRAKMQEDWNKQEQSAQAATPGVLKIPEKGPHMIPAAPVGGILPEAPENREKLVAYLKPLLAESAKALDPASKAALARLPGQGKKNVQWAMVFWANNELGKALYLLADAGVANPDDTLSLNNLGSLLTLSGCAEKSLPLLLYARKIGPENSTLLNNLGQAWLSLGYIDQAQQALQAAVDKDPDNAEAQYSLALIAARQGNAKACAVHIQRAVASGGFTSESLSLLQQAAPEVSVADLIRPRFRQFYKDHSITKRFAPPPVPASYAEAVSRYRDIETFFQNLAATRDDAQRTARQLEKEFKLGLLQAFAGAQQVASQSRATYASKYVHPLRVQAAEMIAGLDDPRYATSYQKRLQREADNRKAAEADVKKSLAKFDQEIAALKKEGGKIEGGEGDIAGEKRLEEIEERVCALRWERQAQRLSAIAQVNMQYLRNVEDLLSQRLQEQTFWSTLAYYPADPTGLNYQYYRDYLRDLHQYARPLYPYYQSEDLMPPCKEKAMNRAKIAGALQSWEMEHCDLDFSIDLGVTGGRMTCQGWTVYADLKFGEFEYNRSVDPVTWETTGHSISAKAGREKEFELGKHLGGKVEADVKTTIKFDGNMNPVDLVVSASAGAEINGPLGGKAGADLGSVELSVNGGFNSSGPSIPAFGSGFSRN